MQTHTQERAPSEKQLAYRAQQAAGKADRLKREAEAFRKAWEARKAEYAAGARLAEVKLEELGLDNRTLWLAFITVEYAEAHLEGGSSESLKTAYVDRVAPQFPARVSRKGKTEAEYAAAVERAEWKATSGVSSFATRYGAKAPLLFGLSHNGYIYPTDLTFELVYHLRKLHPELCASAGPVRMLQVPSLGLYLRNTLWRHWKPLRRV